MDNTNIYTRAFSHDKKEILVGGNKTGIYNGYLINLQTGEKRPLTRSEEESVWVASIKKNNVPVEYVLFEDEGHGFVKKENQIEGYSQILAFLDKYLKEPLKG